MSDVWTNFGKRSDAALSAANDFTGGLIPLALAAAVGGSVADVAIRASKARFQSPWAASVVIFGLGWAMLKFLPREGVRLVVAGMFGRLGPESYANVIKPLASKFGIHAEGAPPAAASPPSGAQQLPPGTKEQPQPSAEKDKTQPKPANCGGPRYAANDEGWVPPDVRPIAQGVLENRQNLYDLSAEIFNEMRRRQMVDPTVANEAHADFERMLEDVFTRMAA